MYKFNLALLTLAVVPLVFAKECTVSDSTVWPFAAPSTEDEDTGGSGGSGGSGGDSVTDVCAPFKDDVAAYQACTETALSGQCAAVGCSDGTGTGTSTGDLISNPGDDLISSGSSNDPSDLIKRLRTRDDFECDESETCFHYAAGGLICFDTTSGEYRDSLGGTGNALTGAYTTSGNSTSADDSSDYSYGTVTTSTATATAATTSTSSSATVSATASSGAVARAGGVGLVWALLPALFI